MSVPALLALLGALCTGPNPQLNYECKEKLVNCAVVYGGTIMQEQEFNMRCMHAVPK